MNDKDLINYNSLMSKLVQGKENDKLAKETETNAGKRVGETVSNYESTQNSASIEKFHAQQGHGFAAERANDMLDKLARRDAKILGDDNAKDGADRIVNGKLIQTKYCQTARQSVDAAFHNGQYRYGKMQLEVPADQYEDAIEIMAKRIKEGKVPGYSNPKDAKKLVRKGNITYEQAVNIAKPMNVDSLLFDAANGAVICVSALGITSVVTFAKAIWDGKDVKEAIDVSVCAGINMGAVAFFSSVLTSQINKFGVNSALKDVSEAAVRLLPKGSAKYITAYFEEGVEKIVVDGAKSSGGTIAKSAKFLRSSVIANVVMLLVISSGDIKKMFCGKISGKQLFKNIVVVAGSLLGGTAGSAGGAFIGGVLGAISPIPGGAAGGAKIGFYLGGFIGGSAGGSATKRVMDEFVEDDAVAMVAIIQERFVKLAQDYMLSAQEISIAIDDVRESLNGLELLEMFASKDRVAYADNLIIRIIEKIIVWRAPIKLPAMEEFNLGIDRILTKRSKVFADADSVETGNEYSKLCKQVTGKSFSEASAKKGLYITQQTDLALRKDEFELRKLILSNADVSLDKAEEEKALERIRQSQERIRNMQNEIDDLLEV